VTGVLSSVERGIGLAVLDEPDRRNAMSVSLRAGLRTAFERFDDAGVRAVVLTANGSAFCAGGDLKDMPQSAADGCAFIRDVMEWFEAVEQFPVPVIAAVNGAAMGGGFELALACDLVVAAATARFGLPETQVGLMAPFAAARLPGVVPRAIAKELALTGRILSAQEAATLGLVNAVVDPAELRPAAFALAERVAARSAHANRVTKALHNRFPDVTAQTAAEANAELFVDPDTRRRIADFAERRRSTREDTQHD
jgi:enoyl-CoA hydratase